MKESTFTKEQIEQMRADMGVKLADVYIKWIDENFEQITKKWFSGGKYKTVKDALGDEQLSYVLAMEFANWLLVNNYNVEELEG